MTSNRTAVIVFNLGGPDRLESVEPFLFNLFNDPAIIGLPSFLRKFLARFISRRREKKAQDIYSKIGGYSPILRNTQLQAEALEQALNQSPEHHFKCFVSMRYWHPFADETVFDVKDFAPDDICLLPLYPQFSTTTTESSFRSWDRATKIADLQKPTRAIGCYFDEPGFISSVAALVRTHYSTALAHGTPRILFSAHGLPKKIVRSGDPYQWQCEQTAQAIVKHMDMDKLDWVVCYQSRVGPLAWIGPSTDDEIRRAGQDKVPIIVVPIAFVSEHSETLVEIDIDYRHLANASGVPFFIYSGTVNKAPDFIDGLAAMVRRMPNKTPGCVLRGGERNCPSDLKRCGCVQALSP